MSVPDPLIRPADVAQELRVSTRTLKTWRKRTPWELPFVMVGRRVFYRRSSIEGYLTRHTVGA